MKLKAKMKSVSNEIGERGWRRQRGAGDGMPGGWRCARLEKRLAARRREAWHGDQRMAKMKAGVAHRQAMESNLAA
jgi:hypothetical protein